MKAPGRARRKGESDVHTRAPRAARTDLVPAVCSCDSPRRYRPTLIERCSVSMKLPTQAEARAERAASGPSLARTVRHLLRPLTHCPAWRARALLAPTGAARRAEPPPPAVPRAHCRRRDERCGRRQPAERNDSLERAAKTVAGYRWRSQGGACDLRESPCTVSGEKANEQGGTGGRARREKGLGDALRRPPFRSGLCRAGLLGSGEGSKRRSEKQKASESSRELPGETTTSTVDDLALRRAADPSGVDEVQRDCSRERTRLGSRVERLGAAEARPTLERLEVGDDDEGWRVVRVQGCARGRGAGREGRSAARWSAMEEEGREGGGEEGARGQLRGCEGCEQSGERKAWHRAGDTCQNEELSGSECCGAGVAWKRQPSLARSPPRSRLHPSSLPRQPRRPHHHYRALHLPSRRPRLVRVALPPPPALAPRPSPSARPSTAHSSSTDNAPARPRRRLGPPRRPSSLRQPAGAATADPARAPRRPRAVPAPEEARVRRRRGLDPPGGQAGAGLWPAGAGGCAGRQAPVDRPCSRG